MNQDRFYRDFEDRFRGSQELIATRLEVYRPLMVALKGKFAAPRAVDLGCGRGEWVRFLNSIGFAAVGVDANLAMIDSNGGESSNLVCGDAKAFIKNLADESQHVISAFHVIEHIDFEALRFLIAEAHRVLVPGGLLILETPNPENILVGGRTFYLDPTHYNPVPSELLSFIVEMQGFKSFNVFRLNQIAHHSELPRVTLADVLYNVSPDYALVAQKGGSQELSEALAPHISVRHGNSLDFFVEEFDTRFTCAIHASEKAEVAVGELSKQVRQMDTEVRMLKKSLAERELGILHRLAKFGQRIVRPALDQGLLLVRRYPFLKKPILTVSRVSPRFGRRLVAFAQARPTTIQSGWDVCDGQWSLTSDPSRVDQWNKVLSDKKDGRSD